MMPGLSDSYWTRDYGPFWVYTDGGLAISDHTYNRPRPNDNNVRPADRATPMSPP